MDPTIKSKTAVAAFSLPDEPVVMDVSKQTTKDQVSTKLSLL